MAKKQTAVRKTTRAKKGASRPVKRADRSRLDTGPLQEHIRKRIKELEGQQHTKAAKARRQEDDTLERLKQALETLEDICHPSMTVPI